MVIACLASLGLRQDLTIPEGGGGNERRLLKNWIVNDECETEFELLGNGSLAAIIFIFTLAYVFLALAIVVDEYFVISIEVILEKLKVSEDVAGAIFMAGGTSAAELFSNLIDTFVYRSNIGFGVIYGTVVFNIFVGVGYSCFVCPSDVKTCDWKVMSRDTVWYMFSIVMVVAFIWDKKVEWYESFILVILYAGYAMNVIFQARVEDWICGGSTLKPTELKEEEDGGVMELEEVEDPDLKDMKIDKAPVVKMGPRNDSANGSAEQSKNTSSPDHTHAAMPVSASGKCFWYLVWPIRSLFYYTIPQSGTVEHPTEKYMFSFAVACTYIAFLSWLMVKFATSIGCIIGVGPILLGTTFLAIGTSIPDSMSTIISAKKGQGPIAVSNTLGSNIFDMQIAIGLPWFLFSVCLGQPYIINHGNMAGPILFLLLSALVLHFGLSFFGWKLRKRLGFGLMTLYGLFLIYVFCDEFVISRS
uniref:Sodium/calcium exchanger membrane region domain-containing protein n=2 Tax=Amorphochlora amoebiformis TaxID=1561963 RepID=A0A7S0CXR9_9EUKA|mmetsp:Transcript_14413/g.22860  ORF Transcript_14413/g.22860 Transcript_14413/m.22860 type:complete len:473 (+) Transcript_14413:121-1539(+)